MSFFAGAARRWAACCYLAMVLGLASACGSKAEAVGAAPDIETYLSCAGGLRESMVVDHDGTGRDPRSPEQMAKDYGAAVAGSFSGPRKVVYRSAGRVDIGFADGEGRVQAVLSYTRHGSGWQLETGVNCP